MDIIYVDMIALFGETSGYLALQCMRERMLGDETGREILRCVGGGEGVWVEGKGRGREGGFL